MATVYDYYDLVGGELRIKSGKTEELSRFLNDDIEYSLEHFIINDSEKIDYITSNGIHIEYSYPVETKKYKNSLLNYIFISEKLNNDLQNSPVNVKVQRLIRGDLKERFNKEKSSFSKMIVDLVDENIKMPDLENVESPENAKEILDDYYKERFEDELLNFMKNAFGKMRK